MNVGKRSTLTLARKVTDPVPVDGRTMRRRDPRTGYIIETEEEFREVKMPELRFLSNRFAWELQR